MGRTSHIIVVTGTGTEVGKTHVAAALLAEWGRRRKVVGYKPIETGVPPGEMGPDTMWLEHASSFHVKPPPFRHTFAEPLSPHLAARRSRERILVGRILEQARALAELSEGLVVELAGGLFTPLALGTANVDLARQLAPTRIVVVAADRLGALHDVTATLRAAAELGLRPQGIVISTPTLADASTGTNAAEIDRLGLARVLAVFPHAKPESPLTRRAAQELVQTLDIT